MASALASAIQQTTNTIHHRKVRYRVLIVAVMLVGLGTLISAIVALSFRPLIWLLALVPLWVGYLISDIAVVGQWRRHILARWLAGELSLLVLPQALAGIPFLPKHTVEGMLATLPVVPSPLEARLPPEARRVLAVLSDFRRAGELRRTLIPGLAVGLLAVTLGAAVALPAVASVWLLLVAIAMLAALALCLFGMRALALRRCLRRVRAETLRLEPGARQALAEAVSHLDWSSVPRQTRQRLLADTGLAPAPAA